MACIYVKHFGNLEEVYIGSAIDFEKRNRCHLKDARNLKHHSVYFQTAFNKYGEANLVTEIFEDNILNEDLLSWEQAAFEYFAYPGKEIPYYNIARFAGSSYGIKRSKETKNKIRLSKIGSIPWNIGQKMNPEVYEKMWETRRQNGTECKGIQNNQYGRFRTLEERIKMSKSGMPGTKFHAKSSKKPWQAKIWIENKEKSLGYFKTQEEAFEVYKVKYYELEQEYLKSQLGKEE
jgi:group I intron endonuclease